MEKSDWSEQDIRINKLTGFTPADRSIRECVSCGQKGHYYYECNGGEFLKMADALVEGLKAISNGSEQNSK